MKFYLFPNPYVKYLNLIVKNKAKSLPLLKNGSRADDDDLNAYTFDTTVFLLTAVFCDSEKYFNTLSSSHEDNPFV